MKDIMFLYVAGTCTGKFPSFPAECVGLKRVSSDKTIGSSPVGIFIQIYLTKIGRHAINRPIQ